MPVDVASLLDILMYRPRNCLRAGDQELFDDILHRLGQTAHLIVTQVIKNLGTGATCSGCQQADCVSLDSESGPDVGDVLLSTLFWWYVVGCDTIPSSVKEVFCLADPAVDQPPQGADSYLSTEDVSRTRLIV